MKEAPYLDPSLSHHERVSDLLGRMTIAEKAGQLTQFFFFGSLADAPEGLDVTSLPAEHLAIAQQGDQIEEQVGAGLVGSLLFVHDPATINRLQRKAVRESRLGIPLLFGYDVIHGFRTVFPVPIAQAASWDPALVESCERVAARESRATGIHWTFAPMIDIARDPRWGRIIEGAGEDPLLAGAMAAAHVRGFQGSGTETIGPESVLAGPKHFAGYGAALGGRDYDDADISDSELWNIYLPPFKQAIDAGAANIMSAYMDLNGVPASGNRWLLTDVLRGELGFDGFVVSDANAVRSMVTQHFAKDLADAGARALNAGLDMEMAMADPAFAHLEEALEEGQIDGAALDEAVSRILRAKFAMGLFEQPYVDMERTEQTLSDQGHRALARQAAEKTLVLLKNDGVLPLDRDQVKRVAVVGQLASQQRDILGPWVFHHDTEETVSILDGLRTQLTDKAEVTYAEGASVPNRVFPSMFDAQDPTVVRTPEDYDDDAAIAEAISVVDDADVAIVVVGQRQNQIGENASVDTLDLPGRQLEQLQALVATGTPVVVVVMSGRPLDLCWADANVSAILQAWYPGTRGGDAVSAALLGEISPAGRLPFTWPRHVGQVPMVYNHYRTFQPDKQNERYWGGESTPLYHFGHGLSYATFEYSALSVDRESLRLGDEATVSVTVTNTSDRVADDVVQFYIHQQHGTSTRPVRELKGFRRITLDAGQSEIVTFPLGPDQLRYWSSVTRGWVQDATTLQLWAGGSSTAELSATIQVIA